MIEICKILVANCQKQNLISLVWRLAILQPSNIICYSCHHIASAVITMTVASQTTSTVKRRGPITALATSLSC